MDRDTLLDRIDSGVEDVRLERRRQLVNPEKVALGQFFTRGSHWLASPVLEFVRRRMPMTRRFVDPFAGEGDLLEACQQVFPGVPIAGFDIASGRWPKNDSLEGVPHESGDFIVTNPPYLARNSARRKGLWQEAGRYLDERGRDDLYQVALDRCLEAAIATVAIVPETLLLSAYPKTHLAVVSVIEEEMFSDTETPVCVACFDRSAAQDAQVYRGDERVSSLTRILSLRPKPMGGVPIRFNVPEGQIGLRAVDSVNVDERIRFMRAEEFPYSRARLRDSSRHMTFVQIDGLPDRHLDRVIDAANRGLEVLRRESSDLALSPFKGNNRAGVRRRRLDYTVARALLERAVAPRQEPSLF